MSLKTIISLGSWIERARDAVSSPFKKNSPLLGGEAALRRNRNPADCREEKERAEEACSVRGVGCPARSAYMADLRRAGVGIYSLTLFAGMLLWGTPTVAQTTTDTKTLRVENEFIQIIVNNQTLDKGRFSIETTKGDPENPMDDNQPLIFGRPIPWTSYTTISVDGQSVIFGGENKKIQKRSGQQYSFSQVTQQQRTDQGIQTVATVTGNIQAEQSLQFFRNPSTRVNDTVLITYTLTNTDSVPHQVGLRLMLDTKLGNNDGAPLRMGSLAVSTEKEVAKKDLFPFWQAFDNLPSPNIVAQGTLELRESDILAPDRVVLANWGSLVDAPWDYTTQEGRSFIRAGETEKDTALALYWDPITLPPQGTRTVRTLYGLGGLSLSAGALSLGLTAPAEYALSSRREILLVGYVSNASGFDAQDTEVTFTLPQGFSVVGGKRSFSLGTLRRDETRQIPLRVIPGPTTDSGPQTLIFSVKSSTLEGNQIKRTIDIFAPPKVTAQLKMSQTRVSPTETEIQVDLTVKNNNSVPVENIIATLKKIGNLKIPDYDFATKNIPSIAPQSSSVTNWRLRVSGNMLPIRPTVSVTVMTPGYPAETLQGTVAISNTAPKLDIQLSRPEIQVGSGPFYLWLSGETLLGRNPGSVDITFDPAALKVIHYSAPEWAATATMTQEKGQVRITLPKGTSPLESLPLGLLHMRALGTTDTKVTIQAPGYSPTTVLIPIHDEVQQ